jgi:predicted enzyme related to lactoylglutathione lyase
MPNPQGWFVWHELSTTDPAAAESFYTQVAPWSVRSSELSNTYRMIEAGGAPLGGIVAVDPAQADRAGNPHWTPYVYVYDVDAIARQAVSLGGQVRAGPGEVPGVGGWALIADPQGATIGIYEPDRPSHSPNGGGGPKRGDFSWHELATTDYQAAFAFYRPLFNWEKTSESDMGPMGVYFMFGQKGRSYGGMYNRQGDGTPPRWLSYIAVADVNPAAATVTRLGGAIVNGPMEVPNGDWIAMARDPQGGAFALQSPKPGASTA